jgi:hypothetical protein
MCLGLNLEKTKELKAKWKESRRTVKIIKELYVGSDGMLVTSYIGEPVYLDKNGYLISDREDTYLNPNEIGQKLVAKGIHAYKNAPNIIETNKKDYKKQSFIFVKVEARKKDFVAYDGNKHFVFTKIKFPKEVIKDLEEKGIKIYHKK